jgi:hypothetical protein
LTNPLKGRSRDARLEAHPTNLAAPVWKIWSPEPIIVRAEDASEAKHLAHLQTLKFLPVIPGRQLAVNPWSGYKKIEDPEPPIDCKDITDQTDEYPVDGAAKVLHHGEKY